MAYTHTCSFSSGEISIELTQEVLENVSRIPRFKKLSIKKELTKLSNSGNIGVWCTFVLNFIISSPTKIKLKCLNSLHQF